MASRSDEIRRAVLYRTAKSRFGNSPTSDSRTFAQTDGYYLSHFHANVSESPSDEPHAARMSQAR